MNLTEEFYVTFYDKKNIYFLGHFENSLYHLPWKFLQRIQRYKMHGFVVNNGLNPT